MNPIADLTKEHGPIKLMLRILEKACGELEAGKELDKENMKRAVTFIREFADKCHHGKEEALLFPAVRENNIPEEVKMVDDLIEEHKIGREYVKNMSYAIESNSSSDFSKSASAYIKLLDQHIDRENKLLFPMTEKSLSETKLKELEAGFEDVKKNVIGEGRHEELHSIIDKLKGLYF